MPRLIVVVLMLAPLPAFAQSPCQGQTQTEMNFCAKARWEAADRELNRLWRLAKPRADARGAGDALLAGQRAWLARRDATCEAELSSGGSAAAMFYWSCMEAETLQRNAALAAVR